MGAMLDQRITHDTANALRDGADKLDAAVVGDLLRRWQLTSNELRAYLAETYDVAHARIEDLLTELSPELFVNEDELILRPRMLSESDWLARVASRETTRGWVRRHVALSGLFARGRRVADVARVLRGQNELGRDVFGWMVPQEPVRLGHDVVVEIDRELTTLPALDPTRVVLEGDERAYDLFCGNDYLGLRVHAEVRAASMGAARTHGAGSGGSRMQSGTTPIHRELERAIALEKGVEDAAIFNSGYQANLAVMAAFTGRDTLVFADARSHASIVDGARLSGADVRVFRHNDVAHLVAHIEAAWRESPRGKRVLEDALIAIESVYSMDGDLAPLAEILEVAEHFGIPVHVDEAHSALVMGEHGQGICDHLGIHPGRVALHMGTLSKAFGGEGGYVAGNAHVVEALKLLSRSFWFSTAPPASSMAGSLAALDLATREPERRRRLWKNAATVRHGLTELGYDVCGSRSWIIPVRIGDEARTALVRSQLRDAGLLVGAVLAPAVAPGEERLRISISSEHTNEQLERLVGAFADLAQHDG